jgi:hypothetical protein
MRSPERSDHWRTSLDLVEALRARMADVHDPSNDLGARQLMAQVAHAKSSSFIALLDSGGHVIDVNPAALIGGGVDRSEVAGLPLWMTPWWAAATEGDVRSVRGRSRPPETGASPASMSASASPAASRAPST